MCEHNHFQAHFISTLSQFSENIFIMTTFYQILHYYIHYKKNINGEFLNLIYTTFHSSIKSFTFNEVKVQSIYFKN